MQHVTDDTDPLPFDRAQRLADRVGVQQRLGRVLVRPVAGVDDVRLAVCRCQVRRPARRVAHHQDVSADRLQRAYGIDQRLALVHTRAATGHVDHIGAQHLTGQFER